MKKTFLIIALAITMVFGATAGLFATTDPTAVHINTYVAENVGNTGIRATTTALAESYTSTAFDTLFFSSASDVTMEQNEDVSQGGQTGIFYILARRVVNNTITIKVTGSELSLNGYPDATIPYAVERVGAGHNRSFNTGSPSPTYEMDYEASPVGGIVRSYENFVYSIPKTSNASSGSYSATITFEIIT